MTRRSRLLAGAGCLLLALLTLALAGAWLCSGTACRTPEVDSKLLATFAGLRDAPLDRVASLVTWLGSILLLGPLVAALAVQRLIAGRRREAAFLLLSLGGATLLGQAVKIGAARPRPDLHEVLGALPDTASFPSAHAMQAMAGLLALALLSPPPARCAALVVAALLALLVGATRLYLQVHFPTDVLFGLIAGGLWTIGVGLLLKMPFGWR